MTFAHEESRRRALASGLIGVLLVALFAFLLPPATALAFAPDTELEGCIRSLHNQARAGAGLHTLDTRSDLVAYARAHSEKMAAQGGIFHSSNLGSATSGWVQVGENVGVGGSCQKLHNAFMNSSGHRENILNPIYTAIGVGGGVGPDGRYYVTVVFAAYKSQAAPTTTTTAPASPQPTEAPKPKPEAPKPQPTTTTVPPTTTTTASVLEVIPEVRWDSLVTELIKIALSQTLPVNLP